MMSILDLDLKEQIDYLVIQEETIKVGEITPNQKKKIYWILHAGWEGDELLKQWKRVIPDILERLNGKIDYKSRSDSDYISLIKVIINKHD